MPGAGFKKDRGRGFFLLFDKKRLLRGDDMDPGLFHLLDLLDGSGQFPLHGALKIQLLHKIRGPQGRPIENLKPHPSAFRKPFRGQGQADI